MISTDFFENLPHFDSYFESVKLLFDQGNTTGSNQSADMLRYTKLGIARMKRGLKTANISDNLIKAAQSSERKNWLIITEAWCGDAGNILPFIVNLSNQIEGVNLKIALRDDHSGLMDSFLTKGSRSIPIFVAMDEEMNYASHWGPRPLPAQNMAMEYKSNPTLPHEEFMIKLQKWYLNDNGETLQQELISYLNL